jgi:preprotein translocase subunit SecE
MDTTKVDTEPTALDTAKLVVAVALLIGGVVAYYYYSSVPAVLRAGGVLLGLLVGAWVAMQSVHGQALWKFIQSSRVELRKVVWPTREETIQTTVAVLVFATIMGVFFWLLDLLLLAITQWLMGQGS